MAGVGSSGDYSNQTEPTSNLDQSLKNAFDEDFFYEPFRISLSTINNQQWPFEMDFEKSFKNASSSNAANNSNGTSSQKGAYRQQSSKSKNNALATSTSNKCYTCKKLPVIKTAMSLDKAVDTTGEPYSRIYTLQNHQHLGREMYSSYGNAGLVGSSNLTVSTYNSSRRCVSAKMIQPPNQSKVYTSRPVYDEAKCTLDNTDEINRNNYNSDYDIEKEVDDEDDVYSKRNVLVNKEEQMRRMSLMPGKSFRSQRTKSISIDHIPISNKKLESQKVNLSRPINLKYKSFV